MKLGDIVNITSGFAFKSSQFNEVGKGMPLIRIRDVGTDNISTFYTGEYKDDYVVKHGDLLIAMDGEFRLSPWKNKPALLNQRVCKIEPKNGKIERRYLQYLLPRELKKIEDKTPYVTVKHLSVKKIRNIDIPLPPLETQKRIADILDKADALRQNDRLILQKYDQLAQSVFLEMFGDPYRNPKKFPIVLLEELIDVGPQNGLYKASGYYGEGTPIVRIDSFYNSVVDVSKLKRVKLDEKEIERYELSKDDILINRVNSPSHLGKCGLITTLKDTTVFESNMMRIKFDSSKANALFMLYILSHPFMKIQILNSSKDAVNQSSINQSDVKNFKIPLPPLSLQDKFEKAIKSIYKLKTKTELTDKRNKVFFQSLLQRAFKGELVN